MSSTTIYQGSEASHPQNINLIKIKKNEFDTPKSVRSSTNNTWGTSATETINGSQRAQNWDESIKRVKSFNYMNKAKKANIHNKISEASPGMHSCFLPVLS